MDSFFTSQLLQWNREQNTRIMPWKGEKDPYKIWLSEIILQQTRVEQGLDYYNRFIKAFPDVHRLAKAPESKIFKLWEGLGYYNRCKNLIATAKFISTQYKGVFPETYEEIKSLKGIGPYTAAAISSFAFNLPYAVLDGNVFRVIARIFGITTPVDSPEGKKFFAGFAQELLDKELPGIYNQAIMDFGAVVCKPKAPDCDNCVFRNNCEAYKTSSIDQLPVKAKKLTAKKRWLYYAVIEYGNAVYIRKRTGKDIWQNLNEFVLTEQKKNLSRSSVLKLPLLASVLKNKKNRLVEVSGLFRHQLTHQTLQGRFIRISVSMPIDDLNGYMLVSKSKLKNYAFPKLLASYIKETGLTGS
jgi:A/G-specific adenine glycosylase